VLRQLATSALLLAPLQLGPVALHAQSSLAITSATLLDGTGAAPVDNAAVVVRDGRIACAALRR
jgi:hypothetical protein